MRKLIIYIILFVLLCFFIPVIFTKRSETKATSKTNEIIEDENVVIEKQLYPYQNYGTIRLLHSQTGEVESLNLDEYLYGVVSAEMPANYEIEALKAQAIVARTYTVYKMYTGSKHENADICDDSNCCQAWISKEDRFARWNEGDRENNWSKILEAVDSTAGKIITYNEEPINAFFHSNSGGSTETVSNVWGGSNYPYLQSVETSGEDGYTQYSSTVILSKEELLQKLQGAYPDIQINFDEENAIQIMEYTDSGRVKTVKFGNINISGIEARAIFELKSAKFSIEVGDNITFNVIGYGHGVGMSQTGADAMAKTGATAEQIISHYYTGVKIENI